MKKIKQIDELLNNEEMFNRYLDQIETNDVQVPKDLNQKIFTKVNNKKKKYFINLTKIAACLIFCLAACRTDFIKEDNFKKYEVKENTSVSQVQEKVSEICTFLTTPLNKEGKDL